MATIANAVPCHSLLRSVTMKLLFLDCQKWNVSMSLARIAFCYQNVLSLRSNVQKASRVALWGCSSNVFVFLLVRPGLKCLKGHKSLRLLSGNVFFFFKIGDLVSSGWVSDNATYSCCQLKISGPAFYLHSIWGGWQGSWRRSTVIISLSSPPLIITNT